MRYKLVGDGDERTFDVPEDGTLIVGRGAESDIVLMGHSVSRQHARLDCRSGEVRLRDLESRNGTSVNGVLVETARLTPGDTVAFGKVKMRFLESGDAAGSSRSFSTKSAPRLDQGPTDLPEAGDLLRSIVHERSVVAPPTGRLSTVYRASDLADVKVWTADAAGDETTQRRLSLLLEVAKRLSRASDVDALLTRIGAMVFEVMDVDHVILDLVDEEASRERLSKVSRNREGGVVDRVIPRSILRKVIEERIALLSDDATEDARFGGQSIIAQRVRSAMCAPLVGSEDVVHGFLYVDNLSAPRRFTEDDLEFLIAFSNIAAAAIENSRFAARIRREALVRSNLERFFAPDLAARIAMSPDVLRLGGEKKTVAILFSDIRGFTALSEEMAPSDLARHLSEYLTVMVEVILRHGGTLDKFIGDAIMAQWGAPIGSHEDSDRALAAAMDMGRELVDLNAAWRAEGRPELEIGIGLNRGEVFAGYIGSERRLEYTVIGDAVNVASRLCVAAQRGEILLTESLREAVADPPSMVRQGDVALRGRVQPVPVYSLRLGSTGLATARDTSREPSA